MNQAEVDFSIFQASLNSTNNATDPFQSVSLNIGDTQEDHHNVHLLIHSSDSTDFQNAFNGVSSNDCLNSDEEPQKESGIPFSNTGHLKYPISEHIRYEYLRNDAYQYSNIPFLSLPLDERKNIVIEQENLLRNRKSKKESSTLLSEEKLFFQSESDADLSRSQSICDWPSRSELVAQLELGVPLAFSETASYGVALVNLAYQGHLSEEALAAAALSLFYMNVTGLSILYGLNGGIDSLGSHMFGSQQYKMVGMIAIRGALIGMLATIGIACLWYFSHYPLLLMGVEQHVAYLSQEYCAMCIWSLPAVLLLDVFRRYLEVQQICVPSMLVNLIGIVAIAPLNSFFMYTLDYGFIGPAYSFIIVNYTMAFALGSYIWWSGLLKQTFPPLSLEVFRNWGQYLNVALPCVGTIAGEWLAFEFQQVIAARLGTTALASQSLVSSINSFLFLTPMSIGIAACARIGCFLGARKTSSAHLAYHSALRITHMTQIIIAFTLWVFNKQIIGLFTNLPQVTSMSQSIIPLLSIFTIIDGHQGMLQGVLRGFSAQSFAFAFNVFWFWIIALPLSIFLSLHVGTHTYDQTIGPQKGLGLIGIWISLLVGCTGVMVTYLTYLGLSNWTKRTKMIYESITEEEQPKQIERDSQQLLPMTKKNTRPTMIAYGALDHE